MNYYEDVHRRAEELAKVWYEDEKVRADTLKEIIMKELFRKGYWHFIKKDEQEKQAAPFVGASAEKCVCEKIKALFK